MMILMKFDEKYASSNDKNSVLGTVSLIVYK